MPLPSSPGVATSLDGFGTTPDQDGDDDDGNEEAMRIEERTKVVIKKTKTMGPVKVVIM